MKNQLPKGYVCGCCGKYIEGIPLDFGYKYPAHYFAVPENERDTSIQSTADWCIIDGKDFFIRGRIEIPIIDYNDTFCWGAWVSVSEKTFRRLINAWEKGIISEESSFFGWLSSEIPTYSLPTLNLKTNVHDTSPNSLPIIELQSSDHPLAIEQKDGITLQQLLAKLQQIMPHESNN
jgi:hypothetical protein